MSRFLMLETLKVIGGVIGVMAALVAVVVALMRLRADRATAWGAGERGSAWFAGLAQPVPVLVGGVLLAIVSGLLLSTVGDDEPAAEDTSVLLLRQLVDEDAQDCREGTPADGASTALTCTFPDRPIRSVRISLFPSVDALRKVEKQKLDGSGLKKGRCAEGRTGWDSWRHGILICKYGERGFPAYLQWSRHDSRVFVEAQALEGAGAPGVYDWWLKESNGAPANNRRPYPDRAEADVLRKTGLARAACARVEGFKGSDVALRCSVPGLDYLFIGRYDTPDALRRALGDPPGGGSCVPVSEGREPGRARYRIGETGAGTRDCHSLEGVDASVVEWTNESTRLYGYASTTGASGAELARIFAWWERTGRFLTD